MSDDQLNGHVRAWLLDQLAAKAAHDRAAAWARVRLLLGAVSVGLLAGVAGGCLARLVLR